MSTLRLLLQTFFLTFILCHTVLGACPEGAIDGFNEAGTAACYLYERFPAQFVTAERLCRDSHGHLASISDMFVNDFVAQGGVEAFDVMQIDNFWIGGDDLEKRGDWKWISGADFKYTNWAENEPTDDGRSFCIAISLPEGQWYARSCYESKPYVCEVPETNHTTTLKQKKIHKKTTPIRSTRHSKPVTTIRHHPSKNATSQPLSACESGWSYLNSTNLCYKLVKDASDCYRPKTQEASIHSKAENNFVGQLALKETKGKENVKVRLSVAQYHPSNKLVREGGTQVKPWYMAHSWGLQDPARRREFFNNIRNNKHHKKHDSSSEEKHDSWVWFDGSSLDFTNWAKSEPKKSKDEFTCAQLNTCYKNCKGANSSNKFVWSSTDCLKADLVVCSQPSNIN